MHYNNTDNMTSVIPNTRILYKQFSKPNKTIIAMYGSCQCDHHYHSTNITPSHHIAISCLCHHIDSHFTVYLIYKMHIKIIIVSW